MPSLSPHEGAPPYEPTREHGARPLGGSYARILEVSPTIADLAGDESLRMEHVCEAIQDRSTERHFWK